jgi:photosystem II stability/assembly factor-like uncharacterized protein
VAGSSCLQAQTVVQLQKSKPASIRGMSVVNDKVAWVSGSKGYVGLTTDGGQTWAWQQVPGFEKSDFRSIVAFSSKQALIMSSGTPAVILKTTDGGTGWKVKYQTTDTAYFFDAMDFANSKHGLVLGDPINGKFVLMETMDAGENWSPFKNPPYALHDEAAFAASGTSLRFEKEMITIVTGGKECRLISTSTTDYPSKWGYDPLLLKHGKASQGAFSFADKGLIVVGGDYQNDHSTDSVAEYYFYSGREIAPENGAFISKIPPSGYQSCVEYISGQTYLSTGTSGSNITTDGGKTWKKIDGASYNVCRKARNGKLVLLAGNNGAIGLLKL